MYTTIEPRLIALLNDDGPSYSSPPSLDLPPLHRSNLPRASSRRPLLLEPDASKRNEKPAPNSITSAPHQGLLIPDGDEDSILLGGISMQKPLSPALDRALGNSSPQSLRKILDHGNENCPSAATKKRHISEASKDDFVQLPKPPKKHKAAKQVVPPIIIGLFEPPPQAALFPPIESSSFHDGHGRNALNTAPPKLREPEGAPDDGRLRDDAHKAAAQVVELRKTNDVRPRKKWTEEETNHLLLGVHKHGVGNWTIILDDPAFSFNERSGPDLKDRFRTCCPEELRGKQPFSVPRLEHLMKSTSGLMSENILIDDNQDGSRSAGSDPTSEKACKKRSHRKDLEYIASLGIEEPFTYSVRRERRAFSLEDDREILEGYSIHGHAWARIQRDPRYHLQDRLPTDLRDRLRNKYPEKLRGKGKNRGKQNQTTINISQPAIESQLPYPCVPNFDEKSASKKQFSTLLQFQDADSRAKDALLPYASFSMHNPSSREGLRREEIITTSQIPPRNLSYQPQASLYTYKDNFAFHEQPSIEPDAMPFSQSFDWGGTVAAPLTSTMGEMDIPRLLLSDPWPELPLPASSAKEKQPEFYEY